MTQYQRGYRIERLAKKKLENKGYYVVRSAGSHGIDLFAFKRKESHFLEEELELDIFRAIMLTLNTTKSKIRKDAEMLIDARLPDLFRKEIWVYKRGKFEITYI